MAQQRAPSTSACRVVHLTLLFLIRDGASIQIGRPRRTPIAARRRDSSRRAPANRPSCCTRGSSWQRVASRKFDSRDLYAGSQRSMEDRDARWAIVPSIAVKCHARLCARIIWGRSRSASVSSKRPPRPCQSLRRSTSEYVCLSCTPFHARVRLRLACASRSIYR